MNVRYRVELNHAEREELTALLSGDKHPVRKLKRAQILLAADAGIGDETIVTTVAVGGGILGMKGISRCRPCHREQGQYSKTRKMSW